MGPRLVEGRYLCEPRGLSRQHLHRFCQPGLSSREVALVRRWAFDKPCTVPSGHRLCLFWIAEYQH